MLANSSWANACPLGVLLPAREEKNTLYAFDKNSNEVYFATQEGICVLSSPFYNISLNKNNN